MDESTPLTQPLQVDALGVQSCAPGHQWGPAVRPYYLIHLVFSGRGRFETEGKTYELEPNQGFIIFPGALTVYRADETDPWRYGWMGYSGELAPMLTRRAGLNREHPVFTTENAQALQSLILSAEQDMASLRMGMAGAAGGLLRFLAHIGQNAPEPPSDDSSDGYFQRLFPARPVVYTGQSGQRRRGSGCCTICGAVPFPAVPGLSRRRRLFAPAVDRPVPPSARPVPAVRKSSGA